MQYSSSYGHFDADTLTREGIAALKAGQQVIARNLLARATEIDPRHEQTWLWLSGAATRDTERMHCLQQVLTINPNNDSAHRGLALLLHPEQPPASLPLAVTTDGPARVSVPQPPHVSPIPPQPASITGAGISREAQAAVDFALSQFGQYVGRDFVAQPLAYHCQRTCARATAYLAQLDTLLECLKQHFYLPACCIHSPDAGIWSAVCIQQRCDNHHPI